MVQPAWQATADAVETVLTAHFGAVPARASVSFLGVEPIEILRYQPANRLVYCSLGMARQPMSGAAATVVDGPRAELFVEVDPGRPNAQDVWKALAVFAAAPAVEAVVYAPGMTVDSGRALVAGSRCTGALVIESGLADVPTTVGLVSMLQLLPATADELAWCRARGSQALRGLWAEQGTALTDLSRAAVALA